MDGKSQGEDNHIQQEKNREYTQGLSQIIIDIREGAGQDDLNGIVSSVTFEKLCGHEGDDDPLEDIEKFEAVQGD